MWTPNEDVIVSKEKQEEEVRKSKIQSARVISSRQFWIAALEIGVTKDSILDEISEKYEGAEAEYLRIQVKESSSFYRDNEIVSELSGMIGIEPYQLDELWLRAASL